jgi:hypothetical protein
MCDEGDSVELKKILEEMTNMEDRKRKGIVSRRPG